MPILDFSGVESRSFEPLPIGIYKVRVYNIELRTSKDSGSEYYNWELNVVEPVEYEGKKLWMTTSLQAQALWNLKQLLEILRGESISGSFDFQPDDYLGAEFRVQTKHESYNGSTYDRVDRYYPATGEIPPERQRGPTPGVVVQKPAAPTPPVTRRPSIFGAKSS